MRTRRIAISACTLCLAIPATAGASPATNASQAEGPYGSPSTGPPTTVMARGPYGSASTGPLSTVMARGPYGSASTGPPSTVTAKGPYGNSPTTRPQTSSAASIHGSAASPRGDTNGWRTAAISGAVLLAAVALAWALLLPARPRMVT